MYNQWKTHTLWRYQFQRTSLYQGICIYVRLVVYRIANYVNCINGIARGYGPYIINYMYCNSSNFKLYLINLGAADCATGASIIYN